MLEDLVEIKGHKLTCVCFNTEGTLLACGTTEGKLVLVDFETRGLSKDYGKVHSLPITCASFSEDGRFLLTTAGETDKAVVFDLREEKVACTTTLAQNCTFSKLHPDGKCFLAAYAQGPPELHYLEPSGASEAEESLRVSRTVAVRPATSQEPEEGGANPVVCNFIKDGDLIVLGNVCGHPGDLQIVRTSGEADGFSLVAEYTESAGSQNCSGVLGLTENAFGNMLALNCVGKTTQGFVRVLHLGEVENTGGQEVPLRLKCSKVADFYDPAQMSKGSCLGWATFSSDSDYVLATSGIESKHHISVWNLSTHKLEHVLEGDDSGRSGRGGHGKLPGVWHMAWCPLKALVVTCGTDGKLYVWTKKYQENWSCFAPGFRELEKNEEYVEREDEFDLCDDDENQKETMAGGSRGSLDVVVDITGGRGLGPSKRKHQAIILGELVNNHKKASC